MYWLCRVCFQRKSRLKKRVTVWINGWEEICVRVLEFGDLGGDFVNFCCSAFR